MTLDKAIRLATCTDYAPTPHEQAGASAVLAKEVERLQAIVDATETAEKTEEGE